MVIIAPSAFSVDPISINADEWTMKFEHEIVLIDVGGITTPIELEKPTLNLLHKNRGSFSFSDGSLVSLTSTPVAGAKAKNSNGAVITKFDNRPTLFISIGGYKGMSNLTDTGDGVDGWQLSNSKSDFQDEIITNVGSDYQYYHMAVDWYSAKSNRKQVREMASQVKNFLNERQQVWDVAIVGHSRGAIFAHELSKKLVSHEKINVLNTMLLDPTAATAFQDVYPGYKPTSNKTKHYADYHHDGQLFNVDLGLNLTTISEKSISGYSTYLISEANHEQYPSYWMGHVSIGVEKWFDDILVRKQGSAIDAFTQEDDISKDNVQVVTIRVNDDYYIDAYVDVSLEKIEVYGEVGAGIITSGFMTYVDGNGIEVAANISVISAATSINEDHVKVSASDGLNAYDVSLYNRRLSGSVDIISGLGNVAASVGDGGIHVSAEVLGGSLGGASISDSGTEVSVFGKTIFSI